MTAIAAILAGCQSPPRGPGDVPGYETIAAAHNARIEALRGVYSRGVIELRWTDDDGRHFEQGDVDLWLELPDRTAFNIEKFGERLLWLGSDGDRAWMFDFRGDERTLYVRDARRPMSLGATDPVPIQPATVLALLGLTRLPETAEPVEYHRDLDAWMVTVRLDGERTRLYLERSTLLPVRAEALDTDGRGVLNSSIKLQRYDRVAGEGAPPGSGPMFPTLADLHGPDLDVKLSLPAPAAERIEPHLFDLDWLAESFKPDRVEGEGRHVAGMD